MYKDYLAIDVPTPLTDYLIGLLMMYLISSNTDVEVTHSTLVLSRVMGASKITAKSLAETALTE